MTNMELLGRVLAAFGISLVLTLLLLVLYQDDSQAAQPAAPAAITQAAAPGAIEASAAATP